MAIIDAVRIGDERIEGPLELFLQLVEVGIIGIGRNWGGRFHMTNPAIFLGIALIERNALVLQMFAVGAGLGKKIEAGIILPVLGQQLGSA